MSWLGDPVLEGVPHGFGTREDAEPAGLVRPHQVHGCSVAMVRSDAPEPPEADAIITARAGPPVGVVTADCVPVLLASGGGAWLAAVHAGWRGLAKGVIEASVASLDGLGAREMRAAIGPSIGGCCYEVDEPVLTPLRDRYGAWLEKAIRETGPGRARLDLALLVRHALVSCGVRTIGAAALACTRCDALRFHSYRREGARSGRLVHWIGGACAALDTPQRPA